MVSLGDKSLFQVESGGTPSSDIPEYWDGNIRWATLVDLPAANLITELKDTERTISPLGLEKSSAKLLPAGTVLVSTRATIGRVAIAEYETATNQGFKNIIVLDDSNISNRFVAYMMTALTDRMVSLASGGTFKEISKSNFLTLSIPLPPLTIQEQIVSELDNYQKIIDGARQVVDNYKPNIRIDFSWELKPLGQICDVRDGTHDSPKFVQDGFPLVTSKNIKNGTIILDDVNFISKEDYDKINQRSKVDKGDILIFPKKYLQKCGIKGSGMYNQIANYVYTQSEINIKIKDQAPKEYMAQVKEQCTGVNAVCGGIDSFFMATIVAAPVPNRWRWNAVRTY